MLTALRTVYKYHVLQTYTKEVKRNLLAYTDLFHRIPPQIEWYTCS